MTKKSLVPKLLAILLLVTPLTAQFSLSEFAHTDTTTVASLPASGNWENRQYVVSDGAAAGDCTTGGGSTRALCFWNGSAWEAYSGGGGASAVNDLTDVTAPSPTVNQALLWDGISAWLNETINFTDLAGAATDAQVPDTITLDNLTRVTTRLHASLQSIGATDHHADSILETELDTEAKLQAQLTDVIDVFTDNDGALNDDNLSDDSVNALNDVTTTSPAVNTALLWDGISAWIDKQVDFSYLSGAVTDAQVPNTITLDDITQITTKPHSALSGISATDHHADSILESELTTEAHLEAQITDVTNFWNNNDGVLADDDLSDDAIEALSGFSAAAGDLGDGTSIDYTLTFDLSANDPTIYAGANLLEFRAATVRFGPNTGFDLTWDLSGLTANRAVFVPDAATALAQAITCPGGDFFTSFNIATGVFTCTTPAGSGITTLNTLTAGTQTFAKVDDTNVTLGIGSATSTHTFTMGWTGLLAASRGGTGLDSSALTGVARVAGGAWTADAGITHLADVASKSGNTDEVVTASGTLINGNCVEWDVNGNAVDSGDTCGGGASLTVEEADGTPTIAAVSQIQFNQADGFTVVDEGSNEVQINLVNAPDSAVANDITLDNITQVALRAISDTTGTLLVARGGTGAVTHTDGGILIGAGTGPVTALGVATNGQIPIGDGTTAPVLGVITAEAGNEIGVTLGVGTIELDVVEANLDLDAIGGTLGTDQAVADFLLASEQHGGTNIVNDLEEEGEINGSAVTGNPTVAAQMLISSGANAYELTGAVPDCQNATTSKVLFNATSREFTCGTDQTSGGGGGDNFSVTYSAITTFTITGATHGLGHAAIGVDVYDNSSPRKYVLPKSVTVDGTSFDVVVTFEISSSGLIVLNGSGDGVAETNDLELNDPPNVVDDEVYVGTGAGAGAWILLPDSDGATQKLQYDQATNTYSAGTDDDVPESGDFGNAADLDASGNVIPDAIGTAKLDDAGDTPAATQVVVVASDTGKFEYVDQSTIVAADHAAAHSESGGDEVTAENLASACTDVQVLGGNAGATGVECQTDDDVPESGDFGNADDLESNGSITAGAVDAAELDDNMHTFVKSWNIENPETTDTGNYQFEIGPAVTLLGVACNVKTATSMTINIQKRTRAAPDTGTTDMLTTSAVCTTTGDNETAFDDAAMVADIPLALIISAKSGSPTILRVHVKYRID